MVKVTINNIVLELNKNECKEILRIQQAKNPPYSNPAYAQRSADIWMRSAPSEAAMIRRKMAVRALGMSDVVTFE